jgi:hypothetical protein
MRLNLGKSDRVVKQLRKGNLQEIVEAPANIPEVIVLTFVHEFAHSLAVDPKLEHNFSEATGVALEIF